MLAISNTHGTGAKHPYASRLCATCPVPVYKTEHKSVETGMGLLTKQVMKGEDDI